MLNASPRILISVPTTTNSPRSIRIIPIVLAAFGIGYFFEAWYELYLLDYISEIILIINATALVLFSILFAKRKQWVFRPIVILSILNLLYGLVLFVESFIDGTLTLAAFGLIIYYLSRSKTKEYFRNSNRVIPRSLQPVSILYGYNSQMVSISIPKGIKHLRKIFLIFAILYFLFFVYLISEFTSQVSEDSMTDDDTRRTKNLNFNKTYEYYFYLIQYLILLGFGVTWLITYLSMRKNKSWSIKIILLFCSVYIGFGKYLITSSPNDITVALVGIIQASLAIVILLYMNRSNVLEYYQNITYSKNIH